MESQDILEIMNATQFYWMVLSNYKIEDTIQQEDICNGAGTKHFQVDPQTINQTFPNSGCYITPNGADASRTSPNASHKLYFINNPVRYSDPVDKLSTDIQTQIKNHIFTIGP